MAQATGGTLPSAAEVHVTGRRILTTIIDAVLIVVLEVVLGILFGSSATQGTSAKSR